MLALALPFALRWRGTSCRTWTSLLPRCDRVIPLHILHLQRGSRIMTYLLLCTCGLPHKNVCIMRDLIAGARIGWTRIWSDGGAGRRRRKACQCVQSNRWYMNGSADRKQCGAVPDAEHRRGKLLQICITFWVVWHLKMRRLWGVWDQLIVGLIINRSQDMHSYARWNKHLRFLKIMFHRS